MERGSQMEGPYETLARLEAAGQEFMDFVDAHTEGASAWWYRLRLSLAGGDLVVSEPIQVAITTTVGASAIDGVDQMGDHQVIVRYHLTGAGAIPISLRIFDVRGRIVHTLEMGSKPPGAYMTVWAATDVARGVFFATLTADGHTVTRKFVLQHP